MPNFGIWDLLVLLVIVLVIWGWAFLTSKALPKVIYEIRKMWYNTDPSRDNHRDR